MPSLSAPLHGRELASPPPQRRLWRLPNSLRTGLIAAVAIVIGMRLGDFAVQFTPPPSAMDTEVDLADSAGPIPTDEHRPPPDPIPSPSATDPHRLAWSEHAPTLTAPHDQQPLLLDAAKSLTYDYTQSALARVPLRLNTDQQHSLRLVIGTTERVSAYLKETRERHNDGRLPRRLLLEKLEQKLSHSIAEAHAYPQLLAQVSDLGRLQQEIEAPTLGALGNCPLLAPESILPTFTSLLNRNELSQGDLYEFVTLCWQQADLLCLYRQVDTRHSEMVVQLPPALQLAHEYLFLQVDDDRDLDALTLYQETEKLRGWLDASTPWVYETFLPAPQARASFPVLVKATDVQLRNEATRPKPPALVVEKLRLRTPAEVLALPEHRVNDPQVKLVLRVWKLERRLQDSQWLSGTDSTEGIQAQIEKLKREYAEDFEPEPPRAFPNWREAPQNLL